MSGPRRVHNPPCFEAVLHVPAQHLPFSLWSVPELVVGYCPTCGADLRDYPERGSELRRRRGRLTAMPSDGESE